MREVKNLISSEAVRKIQDLAKNADICMFTTSLDILPLNSRPMSTAEVDEDGNIWFFSKRSSSKNAEIEADDRVQLFYASKGNAEYLSVYGRAIISTDKEKAKEIWQPEAKAWFTEGVDDPEMSMIKVFPEDAYYWDTKHNKLVALLKMAASVLTGKTMDDGVEGSIKV
jgi:general stress protein 26